MRTKAAFLIGGAVGYVLGTRAGREQFEKIRSQARKVWEDPRVQGTVSDVEQRATGFVKDKAPELKDKVTDAVKQASDTVRSRTGNETPAPVPEYPATPTPPATPSNGSTTY